MRITRRELETSWISVWKLSEGILGRQKVDSRGMSSIEGLIYHRSPHRKTKNMSQNLTDETAATLALSRPHAAQTQSCNMSALKTDIAKYRPTPDFKTCAFTVRGVKANVLHDDECRRRIMEATGRDDADRTKIFLRKNAQKRPKSGDVDGDGASDGSASSGE